MRTTGSLRSTAHLILEDGTRFSGFLHNGTELDGFRALQRAEQALLAPIPAPPATMTEPQNPRDFCTNVRPFGRAGASAFDESTTSATSKKLALHCEFVFNTALTGYEEVITDPSYLGQSVVFTTPHLGTTGWTNQEMESADLTPTAVICRTVSRVADNYAAVMSLGTALARSGVPLISGIDTRALTLKLREKGAMAGVIELEWCGSQNETEAGAPAHPPSAQHTFLAAPIWPRAAFSEGGSFFASSKALDEKNHRPLSVTLIDFGVKQSIIEALRTRGCSVKVIPWQSATFQNIAATHPDGVLFSNGAGDPRVLLQLPDLLSEYRTVAQSYPSFGICFGHQTLAMCFGGGVDKIGFGHHAVNHPVARVSALGQPEKVFITSQNHNYAVKRNALPIGFAVSHLHWNDGSVAGIRHESLPLFSVQFHPEAGPGPRESMVLFDAFTDLMRSPK